jgi:hypothetical protein
VKQVWPPKSLQLLQKNFGQAIRTPVSFATGVFSFTTEAYDAILADSILPRGSQSGRERLAIYNEQYWYRLFTVLQEDYPFLAHTLGFWAFNQHASAYLSDHPSQGPFLEKLSLQFASFLLAPERNLSAMEHQIVTLEAAMLRAFYAPLFGHSTTGQSLSDQAQSGESTIMTFQPAFFLFAENWNLIESRQTFQSRPGPKVNPIPKNSYWVIFQNEARADWKEVDGIGFELLTLLKSGLTLGQACERVAESLDAEALASLAQNIPRWFSEWTIWKWFVPQNGSVSLNS